MNQASHLTFRLYWLRESDCDAGTPVTASDLDPAIRDRVIQLVDECPYHRPEQEWAVRLPFFDRKQWRKRDEILRATPLERVGQLIRAVLQPAAATRDTAATFALTDPAWQCLPKPGTQEFFATWQRVSLALQSELKQLISAEYFADLDSFKDRARAYTMVAYQASRVFHSKSKTEFTYDLRDYPDGNATMAAALRLAGRATQGVLARIEARLRDEGREELARRYSPVFYQDVLLEAQKRPRQFVQVLAAESAIINAVIDLGSDPTVAVVHRSVRTVNSALRRVMGVDMRQLGCTVYEEATRTLADVIAESAENLERQGFLKDGHMTAPGRPHARVS